MSGGGQRGVTHRHVRCNPCGAEFCVVHKPHMAHFVPGADPEYVCPDCALFLLRAGVAVSDGIGNGPQRPQEAPQGH